MLIITFSLLHEVYYTLKQEKREIHEIFNKTDQKNHLKLIKETIFKDQQGK